jgi:hypothetical protein
VNLIFIKPFPQETSAFIDVCHHLVDEHPLPDRATLMAAPVLEGDQFSFEIQDRDIHACDPDKLPFAVTDLVAISHIHVTHGVPLYVSTSSVVDSAAIEAWGTFAA